MLNKSSVPKDSFRGIAGTTIRSHTASTQRNGETQMNTKTNTAETNNESTTTAPKAPKAATTSKKKTVAKKAASTATVTARTNGVQRKQPKAVPADVKKLPTVAAKCRALAVKGWSDGDISRALGISHQHAYNTTHRKTLGYNPKKYGR